MENFTQKIIEDMNYFLIGCGIDKSNHLVLVKADTYEEACAKIKAKCADYEVFVNATIE
jgi:hypothetical protein